MACTSSAGCVPAFARRASLNRLDRRAVGSAVSKSLFFSAPIRFRGANHAAVSSPAVNAAATTPCSSSPSTDMSAGTSSELQP